MVSVSIANNLMPSPKGTVNVVHKKGYTRDIINTILEADKKAHLDTKALAEKFNTLEDIWTFVHTKISYKKDAPGDERIKLPSVTWKDRYADCKSMSLFIGSILKNKGIPYAYRFTKYDNDRDYTHIYVIAYPGGNEIILDAVHDTFNEEVEYTAKKDYKMHTQISMLGSLPLSTQSELTKPLLDAPKQVVSPRPLDFGKFTEGEAILIILSRRLDIAKAYYGDKDGLYQEAQNMIYQAVKNDVHRNQAFIGSIPRQLNFVAQYIKGVVPMTRQAISRRPGVGSLIDVDCQGALDNLNAVKARILTSNPPSPQEIADAEAAYNDCLNLERYEDIINGEFYSSGHHILYERVPLAYQGFINSGVAGAKAVNHKDAISNISRATGISRQVLSEWTENAIMYGNTKQDMPPYTGIETTDLVQLGGNYREELPPSIGFLSAATVATIVKVSAAIVATLTAAGEFWRTVKNVPTTNELILNETKGWGIADFGPDVKDFPSVDGSGNSNTTNSKTGLLLPFALGGMGLYFLTKK